MLLADKKSVVMSLLIKKISMFHEKSFSSKVFV